MSVSPQRNRLSPGGGNLFWDFFLETDGLREGVHNREIGGVMYVATYMPKINRMVYTMEKKQ